MTSRFVYKVLTYLAMAVIGALLGFLCALIAGMTPRGSILETSDYVGISAMIACSTSLISSPLVYIKFVENIRANAVEKRVHFDYSDTLKIKKRGPYLKGLLKVGRAKITNYKYIDPKLVYTGATVGGVSMGGFHIEEGGYSQQLLQTDTYQLLYFDPRTERKFALEWIDLPENDIKAAKKDPRISKLVFRNSICLTESMGADNTWSKMTMDGVLSQDLTKANYGAQQANLGKYQLTQEDLWYVKRWLCKRK